MTFYGNLPSHLPTNRAEVRKLRIMKILNSLENTWRSTYSFLKRPEDSWRSQKLRELWRTGEATPKATPCASLQPCLRFLASPKQVPFLWREKFYFLKSETELELKMNMNKFYGGWSPMGQAFKSMQNQRGFEYRKLDAIKLEIFCKSLTIMVGPK